MPACCPSGRQLLRPPPDPCSGASDDKGTGGRDRWALAGWLAGCGASAGLLLKLIGRLQNTFVFATGTSELPNHCPVQARPPGTVLRPRP